MKFSNKGFFNKCDQIGSFLRIWSNLLQKFLMQNFIFCAVELHYFTMITLRRYDTKKLVDEISLNFPELFIIGQYVKIRFKNKGSPCYFLSSRGQKIKHITKIEQNFCPRSWFHFLWRFSRKN